MKRKISDRIGFKKDSPESTQRALLKHLESQCQAPRSALKPVTPSLPGQPASIKGQQLSFAPTHLGMDLDEGSMSRKAHRQRLIEKLKSS